MPQNDKYARAKLILNFELKLYFERNRYFWILPHRSFCMNIKKIPSVEASFKKINISKYS